MDGIYDPYSAHHQEVMEDASTSVLGNTPVIHLYVQLMVQSINWQRAKLPDQFDVLWIRDAAVVTRQRPCVDCA